MANVGGQFRIVYNKELGDLCRPPIVVEVVTSKRLSLTGHVVWMG